MPPQVDDADEVLEATGTTAEIMARLGGLIDLATGRMANLDAADLAVPARWSGLAVDVGFRIGRWGSHIREHTIQVDKTLAMIGRPSSEVERLVRLIGASHGRLESHVYGRSAEVLARPWPDGGSATLVLESCATDVRDLAGSVARVPAGTHRAVW